MELNAEFEVQAPIEVVWSTVMDDLARTATVIPGAEVTEQISDTVFNGLVKIKVGPLSMQYKGQVELISRDDVNHIAVLKGKALEKGGQGSADGTATISLTADGDTTRGSLKADIGLSGRVAAMGKGVIDSVTKQMVPVVVKNIEALIAGEESSGSAETAGGAIDGLAVVRGVIGSMFHRDKSDKGDDKKSAASTDAADAAEPVEPADPAKPAE